MRKAKRNRTAVIVFGPSSLEKNRKLKAGKKVCTSKRNAILDNPVQMRMPTSHVLLLPYTYWLHLLCMCLFERKYEFIWTCQSTAGQSQRAGADLGVVRVVRSNPLNWNHKRLKPCSFWKNSLINVKSFKNKQLSLNKKKSKNSINI